MADLPTPEIQQAIAGPAIQNALDRGLSFAVQGMMLAVSPKTLQDIHEGKGTKNKFDWDAIERELRIEGT